VIKYSRPSTASLVPRPLPDFISKLWRKIGRRPGIKTTSRTENSGLGFVMMATCPHNKRPILASSICLDVFVNNYGLRRYQVTNKRCVDISGRRFACTLTERDRESSRLRVSTSKQVSVPGTLSSRRSRTA